MRVEYHMNTFNMTKEKHQLTLQLVADRLNEMSGAWEVQNHLVKGPGTTAIVLKDHDDVGEGHIDIGFVLNDKRPEETTVWDCAVGFGVDLKSKLQCAVDLWSQSTANVPLELLTQSGEFAEHSHGDDGLGISGWHTIHSPIVGWGVKEPPAHLQKWMVENPLLPRMEASFKESLPNRPLNGVKFVLGASTSGDAVEVRLNGAYHETLSNALASIDWPRPSPTAITRYFVLFVHGNKPR